MSEIGAGIAGGSLGTRRGLARNVAVNPLHRIERGERQALQSLIRPLLSRSDAELARWREAFEEALGPNARLIVDLIPELKLVVGEPPRCMDAASARPRRDRI